MKRKLGINLIPKTSWYNNLRSNFSKEEWDVLRRDCYEKAGHRCEICGGSGKEQGFNWPVECHEVWDFSVKGTQRLIRLIALCPICHKCQHPGLAKIKGEYANVVKHYAKVNEITEEESEEDFDEAFTEWHERNETEWVLDLSALNNL